MKPVAPGLVNLACQTIRAGLEGAKAFNADGNPQKVKKYLDTIAEAVNALDECTEGKPEEVVKVTVRYNGNERVYKCATWADAEALQDVFAKIGHSATAE